MTSDERPNIEQRIRGKAVARARAKLGLYWHVAAFALANAAMLAINLAYSPRILWFVWPLAGWGIGLLMHGLAALRVCGVSEAMIEAEVRREMHRQGIL